MATIELDGLPEHLVKAIQETVARYRADNTGPAAGERRPQTPEEAVAEFDAVMAEVHSDTFPVPTVVWDTTYPRSELYEDHD